MNTKTLTSFLLGSVFLLGCHTGPKNALIQSQKDLRKKEKQIERMEKQKALMEKQAGKKD